MDPVGLGEHDYKYVEHADLGHVQLFFTQSNISRSGLLWCTRTRY